MQQRTPDKLDDAIYWIGVNALRLRSDAELLHRAHRYSSCIFLSISCIEECVKYCVLWYQAKSGSTPVAPLRNHNDKLPLGIIFSFRELIIAMRDQYLANRERTAIAARSAGIDPEEFFASIGNIPDHISEAKSIEILLGSDSDFLQLLKRAFDTSGLTKLRQMALYADLTDDGETLSLNHPMFLSHEHSAEMLVFSTKTSEFIKATSSRLANWQSPGLSKFMGMEFLPPLINPGQPPSTSK